MIKASLQPTLDNIFTIEYDQESKHTFEGALAFSQKKEADGDIKGACDLRFEACQELMQLLPEDEEISLDWEDKSSQGAMTLLNFSAIDHFLIGDYEMAAAMLELLLELDEEDHLDATISLAYCYVMLEEWELLDEVIFDINEKTPQKSIIKLWAEFMQTGKINQSEIKTFKKFHEAFFKEFTSDEHPADQAFIQDLESERPSKGAKARELWLQTEHLWTSSSEFIEALKKQ